MEVRTGFLSTQTDRLRSKLSKEERKMKGLIKKLSLSALMVGSVFISAQAGVVFKTVQVSTNPALIPTTTGYHMVVDSGTVRQLNTSTFTASVATISSQSVTNQTVVASTVTRLNSSVIVGGTVTASGRVFIFDGTNGSPGIAFFNDTDLGLYRVGSNNAAFGVNGSSIFGWNPSGPYSNFPWYGPDGSLTAPAYSFNNDAGLGLYRAATNNISISANSVHVASFTSTGADIRGTNGSASANTGYKGEYVEQVIPTTVNYPAATNVWTQASTITLTAGDWDVTFQLINSEAGGSLTSQFQIAITSVTGNNTTNMIFGSNALRSPSATSNDGSSVAIANYRVLIDSTINFYGKLLGTYTVATPTYRSRLSARRVR